MNQEKKRKILRQGGSTSKRAELDHRSSLSKNKNRDSILSSSINKNASISSMKHSTDKRTPPMKSCSASSRSGLLKFVERLTRLEEKTAKRQLDILKRLDDLEEQGVRIEDELRSITHGRRATPRKAGTKPPGLPFDTVDALLSFEEATDDEYDILVDYCVWLAGANPGDCASIYYKNVLTDELSDHITWAGARNMTALDGTRIAQAFEDAMSQNQYFRRPNRAEFKEAMVKALNSAKERVRKARAGVMMKRNIHIIKKYDEKLDSEDYSDSELQ